jgi:HK97 gp10 family phage protein
MITVKVNESDMRKALDRINRYSQEAQNKVAEGISTTAINVDRRAKQNAPVDTGRLRADIKFTFTRISGEVFNTVKYAPFIELGTSKMNAQPYLFPAWEAYRLDFLNKMKRALQ